MGVWQQPSPVHMAPSSAASCKLVQDVMQPVYNASVLQPMAVKMFRVGEIRYGNPSTWNHHELTPSVIADAKWEGNVHIATHGRAVWPWSRVSQQVPPPPAAPWCRLSEAATVGGGASSLQRTRPPSRSMQVAVEPPAAIGNDQWIMGLQWAGPARRVLVLLKHAGLRTSVLPISGAAVLAAASPLAGAIEAAALVVWPSVEPFKYADMSYLEINYLEVVSPCMQQPCGDSRFQHLWLLRFNPLGSPGFHLDLPVKCWLHFSNASQNVGIHAPPPDLAARFMPYNRPHSVPVKAKRKKARQRRGGAEPDRLSALPDCLLHTIMSSLKARQAVQTHLWRSEAGVQGQVGGT
ncbi:hypothetical protein HU200_048780 [Digitaria exilis]|uniref:Uncharacterized protein n=1 Tax=Digitaria exilis TaxID=1010633 RepID=A0A835B5F1_9POAL|nr:hypothetical protein HU200_048780 [Digitaria exilis]